MIGRILGKEVVYVTEYLPCTEFTPVILAKLEEETIAPSRGSLVRERESGVRPLLFVGVLINRL